MLTLLIALTAMISVWAGLHYGAHMGGFSIFLSILVGVGIQASLAFWVRRRITAIMGAIQSRMAERTNVLKRKYEQLGSRGGNIKQLKDQAVRDQNVMLAEALETTRQMEPFCKWSFMLDRQINAIRVQFYFQMKKFEEADRLLPKTIFGDPILVCMKMCRQFRLGQDADLKATYEKYRKKFKNDAVLIYSTYAWMLLQKKQGDEVLAVLVDGKNVTADEVIEKNWEHIANGRFNQFSNAALGEKWYVLMLEEPRQAKQYVRQVRPGGRGGRRF